MAALCFFTTFFQSTDFCDDISLTFGSYRRSKKLTAQCRMMRRTAYGNML